MNIDEALLKLATENGFHRLDVGIQYYDGDSEPRFVTTAWGMDIGSHGCTSSSGDTVAEALTNVIRHAAELRAIRLPTLELEVAA